MSTGRRSVRLAPLAVLLAACGPTAGIDENDVPPDPPSTGPTTSGTSSAAATTTTDATHNERPSGPLEHALIVDLAVGWRPEGALSREDVAAQRRRIQAAENAVVRALGEHVRVRRQLHATGQVALEVDDEGLSLLGELDQVAAIHVDTPAPPADGPAT